MKAARGLFFPQLTGVEAEHARRLGESGVGQGLYVRCDVPRQIDVIVFPQDEHLTAGQTGQRIKLLRQRTNSARPPRSKPPSNQYLFVQRDIGAVNRRKA